MLQESLKHSQKGQILETQSSRGSDSLTDHSGICIKSIQIIKPQLDLYPNRKLTISLILHELNDELRKLVRYVSSKYAMNLHNDWESYWAKQKDWIKTEKQKGRDNQSGEGQLIVCDDEALSKVLREMKVNPTLRVLLICKSMAQFELKEEHAFVMVTDDLKGVQQYLSRNRKRLILTSKN